MPFSRQQTRFQTVDALTLTDSSWLEISQQAQQQGETVFQAGDLESQYILPQTLGQGSDREIYLRNGLIIHIRDLSLHRPIRYIRQHEPVFPLVAKFYLAGASRVRTLNATDIASDYEESAGYSYLYYLPDLTEIEEWPAEQPIHVVTIYAKPRYFTSFSLQNMALAQPLQKLLEGYTTQRFHQSLGLMKRPVTQLLNQLLTCPYKGLMQQLYLESKALELLALQFATDAEVNTAHSQCLRLRSHDIQQLHQAREILRQQAEQPPSLTDLAHQVGLNQRKLKQGFRQLFGTTVFGYLQTYRLEQAQRLLCNSDLTVAQVAARVGYGNPEAFSTAFRRKFAVSPKAYQLQQCS
ncbi:MAG: helix-turn-helix transcriptional regulator [Leptolyngbya sp. SIO4C5]|nr:helix-turn-helix transcriptional regulator [Leptolyngbya sp. SIO4C5]